MLTIIHISMRIAFDIDGLLVPMHNEFPVEKPAGWLAALLTKESLRVGTIALMRTLIADGHLIWIYTTSERTARYLIRWFGRQGIKLDGIVNGSAHMEWLRSQSAISCSKYPPAFDIDLLIDDSEGVLLEGQRHGFDVVRIDPTDRNWIDRIIEAVEERTL